MTTKKLISTTFCALLLVLLFAGCSFYQTSGGLFSGSTENPETVAAFDDFTRQLFLEEVTSNTINLHYTLSDPKSYGITDYPVTLGDLSDEAGSDSSARTENYLTTLEGFDYAALSLNQQLTYDLLDDYLRLQLKLADYALYDEYLKPSTGVQAELPILYEEYTFRTEQDVKDYLELISLTDEYFEQVATFEQEKADAGLFMPDYACDNVIAQCRDFIADADHHYQL